MLLSVPKRVYNTNKISFPFKEHFQRSVMTTAALLVEFLITFTYMYYKE